MKQFVIGTAGHIDHGKTALIRALTGRDTDRLPEEKRRGITTDLGFASFDLGDGTRAGMIDVPGHEKFIHNMTAGTAGMDLVLLVIAADEGIMPQTREHMDILKILGVKNYIIVLNKCDLADEEWLEMVEEDIRKEQKKNGMENVPLVRVSARTGQGIDGLKRLIRAYAREKEENPGDMIRRQAAPARLPVDRVFTIQGFGTVVTGTMLEGRIEKGQELTVFPQKKTCRVRGIQVYGSEEEICSAGQRAALNLTGIDKEEIRRGCVLAPEGSLKTGREINVRIQLLEHGERIVKNQSRLHFYSGTCQSLCRAALLDAEQLLPGEGGYAHLLLENEMALRRGDRFVLRFYSPLETIGGGVVLETNAPREKRFRQETLKRLERKEKAGLEELAEILTEERGRDLTDARGLSAELGISTFAAAEILKKLAEENRLYGFVVNKTEYYLHRKTEAVLRKEILEKIYRYLQQYPYRLGMPEAQLLPKAPDRVKIAAEACIGRLLEKGVLDRIDCCRLRPAETLSWKPGGMLIAPAGYKPEEDPAYQSTYAALSEAAKKGGYYFPSLRELHSEIRETDSRNTRSAESRGTGKDIMEILRLLELQGKILCLQGDFYTLPDLMEQAVRTIREILDREGKITISQLCSLLETSRKNVRLILEYTDRTGITKKEKAESERVKA